MPRRGEESHRADRETLRENNQSLLPGLSVLEWSLLRVREIKLNGPLLSRVAPSSSSFMYVPFRWSSSSETLTKFPPPLEYVEPQTRGAASPLNCDVNAQARRSRREVGSVTEGVDLDLKRG